MKNTHENLTESDVLIDVHNVGKYYRLYDRPRDRLLHYLFCGHKKFGRDFWALKDVSFQVRRGEAVGIIGRNGAGKSTLLQLITGTLTPSLGEISTRGRIAAMLQLGSGFNPEFTGRENVYLNGAILGISRAEIERHFDEIVAFADIGPAIDQPLKSYSSGMSMRLAFAVQVALDPDILIIDEALSVGDYFFRQKCFERIRQLRDRGLTLLFVSHDTNTVIKLCSRVVFLRSGALQFDGNPYHAVQTYLNQTGDKPRAKENQLSSVGSFDLLQAVPFESALWRWRGEKIPVAGGLLAICVLNIAGDVAITVRIGDKLRVQVYFIPDSLCQAHIYLQLKNRFNEILFTTGTYYLDIAITHLQPNQIARVEFELEMRLAGGEYSLSIMMGYPEPPNRLGTIMDNTGAIGPLIIEGLYEQEKVPFLGPFGLPVTAKIQSCFEE